MYSIPNDMSSIDNENNITTIICNNIKNSNDNFISLKNTFIIIKFMS